MEIITAVGASWLRILIALALSVTAAIPIGIGSALNRRFEWFAVPVLDVLQSVPILGFFPVAVITLSRLSPVFGIELASIFLIFTCTFWNFAFGVYESVRSIPVELREGLKLWNVPLGERLTKVYIPASMPRILSNLQPSTANAWFFLSASEVMVLGREELRVHGVGYLVEKFAAQGDLSSLALLLSLTLLTIGLVQFVIYAPLVSRAIEGVSDHESRLAPPRAIVSGISAITSGFRTFGDAGLGRIARMRQIRVPLQIIHIVQSRHWLAPGITAITVIVLAAVAISLIDEYGGDLYESVVTGLTRLVEVNWIEVSAALAFSMMRVLAVLAIAACWSIPVAYYFSVKENLRRALLPVVQVVASFPAPLLFPVLTPALASTGPLGVESAAILMMLIGSQYYVFYSVLQGFMRVDRAYSELSGLYGLGFGYSLAAIYLPHALPSLITGAITTAGGAWNATVVAEAVEVGGVLYETALPGLGKEITGAALSGDVFALTVYVCVMTLFIVALNRTLWRRLYDWSVSLVAG
ncbi:MAG: ABC transporter permease subunit [Thaumarchaeota archaeon]|nr:ABC transporter permease subunit [Candidatus Calditenuaceae archaeon]MDW8187268.1 ABC transporter permease subunit [Nitrososphaerota archaeon]